METYENLALARAAEAAAEAARGGGGARRRRAPPPRMSNEREPETSPWRTGPFHPPVRLAVGDDDDDELAMELAAEFGIEMMCV